MDFGTLKNNFTNILIESYLNKDEKGKFLYKKFLKTIKENEALKSYFIVYKNIETKTLNSDVEANEYLKENLNILDRFKGNPSVTLGVKKLTNILKRSGVVINEEPINLHKSLNNILTLPKNVNNIDVIHESKSKIIDWLISDKDSDIEYGEYVVEGINPNKFLQIAVNKYNEKYSNLSDEEKNILKVLRENEVENMTQILDSLVKENIQLINQTLKNYGDNKTVKEKLLETKDMVYMLKEYDTNIGESILKLLELKTNLSDD